jgi:chromosomal replication initiator protein
MDRPDPPIRDAVLAHLRSQHPGICRHWFDDIELLDVSGGTLRLLVREQVQLRYLQRCCIDIFTDAAQAVTGRLLAVRFIGENEVAASRAIAPPAGRSTPAGPVDAPDAGPAAGAPRGGPRPALAAAIDDDSMLISPDFSFENFVIGPENRLAHAAAVAVSQRPGRTYNPLFIHAGVGLGKTHLLHAVCQALMGSHPDLGIVYISCNGFVNQFHKAVQAGQMNEFRHRFRHVDILLIDDIHDLANREPTQEEFFHTFNTLHQAGRQIVLSSDAPPREIPHLEERLISRFHSGLVARIDPPCFETRLAIVKAKAALRNLPLADDVAEFIAGRIESSVRELEGVLTTLQGTAMASQVPIGLALAEQVIGPGPAGGPLSHPSIQSIIEAVSGYYDVKPIELLSKRRHKSIALPRQIGMWLARHHTRYSLQEIGGYFGGRDHTTVMHAVRTIDLRRERDSALDLDVARLQQRLGSSGP